VTPRDRRALQAGGAIVACAVLLLRVAPWAWSTARSSREALEARTELLARMRMDLREADHMEDSGRVVRAEMARLARAVLSGGSATEAATDLGARVSLAAERHRVRLSRTEVVADSARAGAARRVAVRATLESDTSGLLELLDALAREPAALTVEELRVAVAGSGVGPSRAEVLSTEITVRGWYLPARSAP
jgi:hypothetical protein